MNSDETPAVRPDDRATRRTDDTGPERLAVPDWMRQPEQEHPLTRTERLRLGWENHPERLLGALGGLLVLALLVGVGWLGYRVWQQARTGPTTAAATAGPDGSPAPGSDAEHWARYRDRWAGTPAQTFPSGATGIMLPPARATGPYTAAQVRDGLALVRRALVEARLGPRMLAGDNKPFLALMAPADRPYLAKDFADSTFLSYATRISKRVKLARDETPRVKGTVTYRSTRDDDGIRVLEITTRFTWVYLFDVPATAPDDALAVVTDEVVWHVPHRADVTASSRGLWLAESRSFHHNIDCAEYDRGYLSVGLVSAAPGGAPELEPEAYYDPAQALAAEGNC
ncbi:hypothetical protein [Micromonospora echinofusca]|uniref:Uncharacterized protein n=1 Tax=Micromonospora echinofusca TaxID=47858 RepID=A0ABS3VTP8_MICEH|nr:hypothetical protein [Micromonospora echinofusca]MBO4207905.1 hypothetical protein [Micromonospora echinofusca]